MWHIAIISHRQAGYPILLQRSFFFFARRSCSEQSAFHGQASDRAWFFSELLFQSVAAKKKKKRPVGWRLGFGSRRVFPELGAGDFKNMHTMTWGWRLGFGSRRVFRELEAGGFLKHAHKELGAGGLDFAAEVRSGSWGLEE